MPGLIGLKWLNHATVDEKLFRNMCQEITCRSGDRLNCYLSPDRSTAVARLHKGILNPQDQPAKSMDGRVLLFLDGEVFNDDLDQHSQAEAILEAYGKEGTALFSRLNGSFTLVLIEPDHDRLTIVCDRVSSVPIYYTQQKNLFAFCAELKPLVKVPELQPRINPLGVENFLASGYMINGESLLEGVWTLRPGEMLMIESGKIRVDRYWQFNFAPQRDLRDNIELEEELFRLCYNAVKRQTRGNYCMAVPLSGGYDSRSILYYLRMQNRERKVRTVTWGEYGDRPDCDVQIANKLAEHLNTDHNFFPLEASALPDHFHSFVRGDEGRTDAVGNYPEFLRIFERIRDELGIDILLRGNEIFGIRWKVYSKKGAMHTAFLDDLSHFPHSFHYLKPRIYRGLLERAREQMRMLHEACLYKDPVDRKDFLFVNLRYSGYQSPLTQLKRQVVEERNPYTDNDVIDFVSRLPSHLRIWKNLFVSTVKNQIPGSTEIEFSKRINLVDWNARMVSDKNLQTLVRRVLFDYRNGFDEILEQKKLHNFIDFAFTPRKTERRSLFVRARKKLRKQLGRYALEPSTEIFRLMLLKLWADEFLKGNFDLRLS